MSHPPESQQNSLKTRNRRTVVLLGVVAPMMFGFAFALSPLYELVCRVTGINSVTTSASSTDQSRVKEASSEMATRSPRMITLEFDATLNGNLDWEFRPATRKLEVMVGQPIQTEYFAKNNTDRAIVTQAVPGVTPWQATSFVKKIECFCFQQQTLEAGEGKDMGIRLVVDEQLPSDINTITLSYTLMNVDRTEVRQKGISPHHQSEAAPSMPLQPGDPGNS